MKLFFFSMKGKLLISSPGLLTDMIFYKSIILIVDQTDEDITGFILNRPSNLFMNKEIDSSKKIKAREIKAKIQSMTHNEDIFFIVYRKCFFNEST